MAFSQDNYSLRGYVINSNIYQVHFFIGGSASTNSTIVFVKVLDVNNQPVADSSALIWQNDNVTFDTTMIRNYILDKITGGATATATESGGNSITVNVANGGSNYTNPPSVILSGGGGTYTSAIATLTGGKVTSITVTGAATYTSTPTVSITNSTVALTDFKYLGQVGKDLIDFYNKYSASPKIQVIGTGMSGFTSSVPNSYEGTTGGLGALYTLGTNHIELSSIITVAETRDTIVSQNQRDFGATMLVPGIRKFSILLNFRDLDLFGKNWGIGGFVNISPMIWQMDTGKSKINPSVDSNVDVKYVMPMNFEVYVSYLLFKIEGVQNPARATIDMGISYRYLGGDNITGIEMKDFLGTYEKGYFGFWGGLDIHLGPSKAYFYVTWNPGWHGDITPGLGGLQAIGGLGLTAPLFSTAKKSTTPVVNN